MKMSTQSHDTNPIGPDGPPGKVLDGGSDGLARLGSTSSPRPTASKTSSAPHRPLLLRARVRPGDGRAMRPSADHLLAPLPVAGLLQSAAFGLDGQKAGGHGSQEAAAAVNRQRQVHGGFQHDLGEGDTSR